MLCSVMNVEDLAATSAMRGAGSLPVITPRAGIASTSCVTNPLTPVARRCIAATNAPMLMHNHLIIFDIRITWSMLKEERFPTLTHASIQTTLTNIPKKTAYHATPHIHLWGVFFLLYTVF